MTVYIKTILFPEDLCLAWQKGVIAQLEELTGLGGIAEDFDEICPGWRGEGISSSNILQWCKLHGRGAAYYMEDRQLEVFPGKRPIVWSVWGNNAYFYRSTHTRKRLMDRTEERPAKKIRREYDVTTPEFHT